MRGADLLVQTLAMAGVKHLFSLSGNQIMPIYDACVDTDIEIVHTRHEAAAVFMADAYAQLTGNVGVCLVTAAPGAANAVGPLYTARQSESPVVLLTGDSPQSLDGMGAFQELDQIAMTVPLSKLSFRANDADDLGQAMARALQTAQSGRPGPVHLALPFDVLEAQVTRTELPDIADTRRANNLATNADLQLLTSAISRAAKPLVLCGPALNATRFGDNTLKLAEALDVSVIPMESPRGLKDPSLGNFQLALANADLIVCMGKPVNFTLGFGKSLSGQKPSGQNPQWIVVDAEADELVRAASNLGDALLGSIEADPRDVIDSLVLQNKPVAEQSQWRSEVRSTIAARPYVTDSPVSRGKISPAQLCTAVQDKIEASSSSVVVCDGGEFGQWAQACTTGDYRVINGPSGAIGGGLCYAVAACKAKPDSTVFALMGDGTAGFHFAEFETAARENTPFVAIIGNDHCWNAEHQIQLREYGHDRLIGCALSEARYDLAVVGLGGHGEYVTEFGELDGALERAIASGKVACVNVVIEGLPAPAAV